ncbi:MAG TPA: AIR synthase related protein [Mycobacteriales bacterium]|nr:AIR synthase related protein [Mycobacteriales bacterium]
MSDDDPYKAVGVDYDLLDALKRAAMVAARSTSPALDRHGGRALERSRGEPAFVFELGGLTLAFVQECLGTKSVIARKFAELTGENRFADVAYDAVAAIANDLVAVGALPLVINAYFATGSPRWLQDSDRGRELVEGWRRGCETAGAAWGGGESPTLVGLVSPEDVELAGSGVGMVPAGRRPLLGDQVAPGAEIVLVASSGIHTNGLTLAVEAAGRLPGGLAEPLPGGESFGSALLRPSLIYVPLLADLIAADLPIGYVSHVTGHGFRKLMRADRRLTYHLTDLPPVPEVLAFVTDVLDLDPRRAYGTFNMGAGLALLVGEGAGGSVVDRAAACGFDAIVAGTVLDGPRRVVVEPLDLVFEDDELRLR